MIYKQKEAKSKEIGQNQNILLSKRITELADKVL